MTVLTGEEGSFALPLPHALPLPDNGDWLMGVNTVYEPRKSVLVPSWLKKSGA